MLVERDVKDNLEAINDLSVDVQKDIETIDEAIGALSVVRKQSRPIGSKRQTRKNKNTMDTAQTTGLTCPKCSGFIPLSLDQLLKSREFLCPHCGLRLTIDRKPSKQDADTLEKNKHAEREKVKTDA